MKILTGVRYIPEVKRNLISLGMLESKGYSFNSEAGCMSINQGQRVVMKAMRKGSLYYLLTAGHRGDMYLAEEDKFRIWHERLGNVGERESRSLPRGE